MKNLKYIILVLAMILVIPFVAFAEEEEATTAAEDNRVIIYFFHGETCPHCQEAREWFESIQEDYGEKFRLVEYEVWNNEENSELMQKVNELRSDGAEGVPYIICGDQSWVGFSKENMAGEITQKIDEMYDTPVEERYDVMALLDKGTTEESKSSDVVSLIIILLVAGGIGFGIYKARQATN